MTGNYPALCSSIFINHCKRNKLAKKLLVEGHLIPELFTSVGCQKAVWAPEVGYVWQCNTDHDALKLCLI